MTGGKDGIARIWEIATGNVIAEFPGHAQAVVDANFSPDGNLIVTASADGVRVWGTKTGKLISLLRSDGSDSNLFFTATFSPDGSLIVAAGYDNFAHIWDAGTTRLIRTLRVPLNGPVWSAAFSPDGGSIVTTAMDGITRIWAVDSGKIVGELREHKESSILDHRRAVFSPNGKFIVTTGSGNDARVWEISTSKVIAHLSGHQGRILNAAFSPDSRLIVTAGADGAAQVYSCGVCGPISDLQALARARKAQELSADERRFYLP